MNIIKNGGSLEGANQNDSSNLYGGWPSVGNLLFEDCIFKNMNTYNEQKNTQTFVKKKGMAKWKWKPYLKKSERTNNEIDFACTLVYVQICSPFYLVFVIIIIFHKGLAKLIRMPKLSLVFSNNNLRVMDVF